MLRLCALSRCGNLSLLSALAVLPRKPSDVPRYLFHCPLFSESMAACPIVFDDLFHNYEVARFCLVLARDLDVALRPKWAATFQEWACPLSSLRHFAERERCGPEKPGFDPLHPSQPCFGIGKLTSLTLGGHDPMMPLSFLHSYWEVHLGGSAAPFAQLRRTRFSFIWFLNGQSAHSQANALG